jgi:two-component system sensor histidine kinase BaeS
VFGLFAAWTVVVGIWAVSAIVGIVEAPAAVLVAGIIALIVVAIGTVVVGRAGRRMTEPLDELVEASRRIEAGDYTVRVTPTGTGGMRSLTRAFNQMSERLEASDVRRRAFLAEVTHELRTPLTVLQGQLEGMEDGVYELDREHISAMLVQTRQMTRLVADLHTISLAEAGALRLDLSPTDLGDIVDEVATAHAQAARAAGIDLVVDPDDVGVIADVDAAAMRRVLGNLMANALRHSSPGDTITLTVRSTSTGEAVVEVSDTGEGMEADLASRAFDRFVKGPDSDGSGLGLAIARDLVVAQGGAIGLRSVVGEGTTVTITIPRVRRA